MPWGGCCPGSSSRRCITNSPLLYYNRAMPISVRLPPRVEQKLADYCVDKKVTKSEAVKRALEQLLDPKMVPLSQDPFFSKLLGSDPRPGDIAQHTKRLLRSGRRK